MRLRLGSGGSATLSVTGKGRLGAVMVPPCSPGCRSTGQYCSRLERIERPARLVSNLEQPITTLKSRMIGYHRLTIKRCAPRFQRKHLCKNHFGRIKKTPIRFSRKLGPAEQRQTIRKISMSLFKAALRTQRFLSRPAG
jgi:hypothetical protein